MILKYAPLVALVVGNAMAAEPPMLGRLFLTPEQRQQIDHERNTSSALAGAIVIDGEIRQGTKRALHWSRDSSEWQPASHPRHAPIGDAYQPATAEVLPLLGNGRIAIHPAKTKP